MSPSVGLAKGAPARVRVEDEEAADQLAAVRVVEVGDVVGLVHLAVGHHHPVGEVEGRIGAPAVVLLPLGAAFGAGQDVHGVGGAVDPGGVDVVGRGRVVGPVRLGGLVLRHRERVGGGRGGAGGAERAPAVGVVELDVDVGAGADLRDPQVEPPGHPRVDVGALGEGAAGGGGVAAAGRPGDGQLDRGPGGADAVALVEQGLRQLRRGGRPRQRAPGGPGRWGRAGRGCWRRAGGRRGRCRSGAGAGTSPRSCAPRWARTRRSSPAG